jgi:hypothetical protein
MKEILGTNIDNFIDIPNSSRWIKEISNAFSKFFIADPNIGKSFKETAAMISTLTQAE